MSFWAKELAPNLFDTYDAWYRNYVKECGSYPGTDELKVATDYFKLPEYKEAKWLYRLEAVDPKNGLWYNEKCELVWGIGKLPDCKTKDLPMDYDERYHKDGKNWYSSCSRKEDLSHWYSLQDALDLIANGFVFTRYLATEYVEYEQETTFIKETALAREVLDITDIWEDNKNG